MDLALNDLQWLICQKIESNQSGFQDSSKYSTMVLILPQISFSAL